MEPFKINVSILIATYNGEKKIAHLLDSLFKQSYKNFELIIIIDGSTDNTHAILKNYPHFKDCMTIINKIENNGRPYCLDMAADQAKGDLLIFFDDDMLPEIDCVEQHVKFHSKQSSKCILVGNGYRPEKEGKNIFDEFLLDSENVWRATHPANFQISIDKFVTTTCNLSMSKSIFKGLNGFDKRLYDLEDVDITIRALRDKIPVYYNSNIKAWHNDFPTLKLYVKRLNQYHQGKIKLLSIHPEYKDLLPKTFDFRKKFFLRRWVTKPFRTNYFLNIDKMLNKVPGVSQKIFFFIFRLIISSNSDSNK